MLSMYDCMTKLQNDLWDVGTSNTLVLNNELVKICLQPPAASTTHSYEHCTVQNEACGGSSWKKHRQPI
jgi:hypothetical protein